MCLTKKMPCDCHLLGPFPSGEVQFTNGIPIYKLDIAKVDDFVGRQFEMQQIIEYLNSNRLVTITGLPGIGKTAISKNVASFLYERNNFKDGV